MGDGDARDLPRHAALGARGEGGAALKRDERLAHLTKEAWRAFVRALQARLGTHGVPFGHWTFLRVLWEGDGITQRELSEAAGVAEPSTAAAIRTMEELGYITRRQMADNRKNVYVHLTAKGRALKAKLEPLAEEVNALAVRGAPAADVAAARRMLHLIVQNLSRPK